MFESMVYSRERHTPWARVSLTRFIYEMIWHGTDNPLDNEVILKAHYRHNVASRIWYSLEWTGCDGQRYTVDAKTFDKLLWRAAEREMQTRAKIEQERVE